MNNINNNPIQQLIAFMQNGGNPEQMAQQMLQQYPQMQNDITILKNMAGKMPADEFAMKIAMQQAKQQGFDIKQFEQLLHNRRR